MREVSDASFEQDVLQVKGPVLVDFWAEWCVPCKLIAPMLERLDSEFSDRVTMVKLNIEQNPQAPTRYSVRSIPTLILFKAGHVAAVKVGGTSQSMLTEWLTKSL